MAKGRRPQGDPCVPAHITHTPPTTDQILALIAADDPRGVTAADVARALGRPREGENLQAAVEDLVTQGFLTRHGLGHGALSIRASSAPP